MTIGGLIVDVSILAIVAVFIIIGVKRGFVLTLLPLLTLALAILLGYWLRVPVKNLLAKTSLEAKIGSSVTNIVESAANKAETSIDKVESNIREKAGDSSAIPTFIVDKIHSMFEEEDTDTRGIEISEDAVAKVSAKITSVVMNIIAFLIVAVIVAIIVTVVRLIIIAARDMDIPVLHQMDSVLGGILAFLISVLVIYGIMLIFGVIFSCGGLSTVANAVNESWLGRFLYNHNLIGLFVNKF